MCVWLLTLWSLVSSPTFDVAAGWEQISGDYWASGAYATRGEANAAAQKSLIATLEANGDDDRRLELLDTEKVPGNSGTKFGDGAARIDIKNAVRRVQQQRVQDHKLVKRDQHR